MSPRWVVKDLGGVPGAIWESQLVKRAFYLSTSKKGADATPPATANLGGYVNGYPDRYKENVSYTVFSETITLNSRGYIIVGASIILNRISDTVTVKLLIDGTEYASTTATSDYDSQDLALYAYDIFDPGNHTVELVIEVTGYLYIGPYHYVIYKFEFEKGVPEVAVESLMTDQPGNVGVKIYYDVSGTVSKTVTLDFDSYVFVFGVALHGTSSYQAESLTLQILIDSEVKASETFTPSYYGASGFVHGAFKLTAGSHTIELSGDKSIYRTKLFVPLIISKVG